MGGLVRFCGAATLAAAVSYAALLVPLNLPINLTQTPPLPFGSMPCNG